MDSHLDVRYSDASWHAHTRSTHEEFYFIRCTRADSKVLALDIANPVEYHTCLRF